MKELSLSSYKELESLRAQYKEILRKEVVHRENFSVKTYDSFGSYLNDCKSCTNVFFWEESENCVNCLRGREAKDCIDSTGCWKIELSGNNSCCTNGYKLNYSIWCDGARYCEYCDECLEIDNCFGCVSLRKKKYCILNKQYTKEEYEELKEKIIEDMKARGEYGKFPPYSMGLCPYNLSTASIYFPEVTKEYVVEKGGYWEEVGDTKIEGMLTSDLPDSINDVDESVKFTEKLSGCTVHTFEPNPESYQNVLISTSGIENIHVHNIAASNFNGKSDFYVTFDNMGGSSLLQPVRLEKTGQNIQKIEVDVITLKDWCEQNNVPKIDMMWMDVQGSELNIFTGMGDRLNDVKSIYVESSMIPYYDGAAHKDDVINYLSQFNFELVSETHHDGYEGDFMFLKRI
jgi:FkbM family methyltransferase